MSRKDKKAAPVVQSVQPAGIFVPLWLYETRSINANEKFLLLEINKEDKGAGCKVDVDRFTAFLEVTKPTTLKYLANLKEKGYIVEEPCDDKGNMVLKIHFNWHTGTLFVVK